MKPSVDDAKKVLDACVSVGARIHFFQGGQIIAGMWIGWNDLGQPIAVLFSGSAPIYDALDPKKLKDWYVPLEEGEWTCTEKRFNPPSITGSF